MKDVKNVKKATVLLKVLSVVFLLGILGYTIYNYYKNYAIDVWCVCLIIFLTMTVCFAYFPTKFMFNVNAKRNRILLYTLVPFICSIPSVFSIISEFTSGRYVENTDVMAMLDAGSPIVFVAGLWVFIVLLLYSVICAVVAIYVEKGIIPKQEEMAEGLKAKLEIELQKQKDIKNKKQ